MNAEYFMTEGIEGIFDVTVWPKWLRRSFVLTLPVSAPLYAVAFLVAITAAVVWWLAEAIVLMWR